MSNFCEKCVAAHFSCQMLAFETLGIDKKWHGNLHEKAHIRPSRIQNAKKTLNVVSWNPPQINKNLRHIVSFLVLPSPGTPGSPNCRSRCQSGGTRPAKWLVLNSKNSNLHIQCGSYQTKWHENLLSYCLTVLLLSQKKTRGNNCEAIIRGRNHMQPQPDHRKSAGPSGEGPPGCEGFPLSCILVPLFCMKS